MTSNRRAQVSDYYRAGRRDTRLLVEKAASAAARYAYHGPWSGLGIVVRTDLNGYSTWARDRDIATRVMLLNEYFSIVVPSLENHGGIYFRDEGDCIVGLFSEYVGRFTLSAVLSFCKDVAAKRYQELSCKVSVACGGQTAIFQKFHEQESGDWSAEGEAFVAAARLEQAIPSKPRIYFFSDQYNAGLGKEGPTAEYGERYFWTCDTENLQVRGLGLEGGWTSATYFEHVPGGRIQT